MRAAELARPPFDRAGDPMPDPQPDFSTLLARARQGNQEALAYLSRQYEPKLRIVARVLLGPALRPYLDSVDLVQSVHRSLLLGIKKQQFEIAGPENLVALALTLVRRKVARKWRHMQRQQRFDHGGSTTGDLANLLTSLSGAANPARTAELREQVDVVCANLDETERQIFELRSQGYTTAEIACQLGLNDGALRVRMTRLRQRLRSAGLFEEWL
jgi:RNA polymerase sigma-70 factor (ECF subfamily)